MSILIPHAWIDDPGRVEKLKEIHERIQQNFEAIALNGTTQAYVDGEIADVVAGGITFGAPTATVNAGDSAVEGVSIAATRADHQHAVSTASAATLSGSNAEGTATSLARSDHNHALGGSVGGVLSGTLPNPSFAADMATQAELDTAVANAVNDGDSAGGALDGTYPNPGLAASVAGDGLTETSNVLAVGAGTGITVSANAVAIDDSVVATDAQVTTAISNHDADTTVHGIDTANVPTSNQKAALAGTSGSPSNTNRYVTDEDGRFNVISIAYSDAVLGLSPALYWRFTETAGTAVDDSTANNRDGTTTGTVTRNVTSLITSDSNPAIDLGGGYVTSTYDPFADPEGTRTFCGWASGDTLSSNDTLIGSSSGTVPHLYMDGTNVYYTDTSFTESFGHSVSSATTFFWAFSCDGSVGRIYINGVLIGTTGGLDWSVGGNVHLGANNGSDPFDGKHDEFVVFETALTAGQIEYLYSLGLGTGGSIPKSIIDAKGDLLVGSANNEVDNLTVGANDTILMADSGQTLGVKWVASAAPAASTGILSIGTADTFSRGDHTHGPIAAVSALPASPADGEEVYYIADTSVLWHLKYRSTTNKWHYIGGPPMYAEVLTSQTTASTTYTALATAGPSITVPLAGDYEIAIGCLSFCGAVGGLAAMSYDIGGTGAVDADGTFRYSATAAPSDAGDHSRFRRKTGLAASTALVAKYKAATGTAGWQNRWMRVIPVRLDDV